MSERELIDAYLEDRIGSWGFVRRLIKVHPELPAQLLHRVLVEGDAIDVGNAQAGLLQAEAEGGPRYARIMLHAREAFLLRSRDKLPVAE